MKLIVGLGNPGPQYAATRHNAGFRVTARLAAAQGWRWSGRRDRALLASGTVGGENVVLAQPQTYMNDSGLSVAPLVRFYKLAPADLLVICDDLDLPVGKLRLRAQGSAGGQHGLESIIASLGTNAFARLRVGIGRPANAHMATIDYVLGVPRGDEAILLDQTEDRAAEAALVWLAAGLTAAMDRFNAEPQAPKPARPKPDTPEPPNTETA